jgi:hypothetical protein
MILAKSELNDKFECKTKNHVWGQKLQIIGSS